MRPKFEWLLNVAFVFLAMLVGGVVTVLAQFPLGALMAGIIFYGGFAYLGMVVWREERHEKPRWKLTRSGFSRGVGIGTTIVVTTLVVLLVGTYLFY